MACGCGARATYKADVGSFLHADYCDDSALVIARKKAPEPKLECYVNTLWGVKHPAPTVTVVYSNTYVGSYAGTTKHFCDTCCPATTIMSLNKQGCIVTKAGTDEILRP